ncbi:unnamed protein product [Camellia sinensis]
MRGRDRINPVLPDELILEVFHKLDSKPSHDACSLVCKRWLGLARLNRTTIRVGSSDNADALVQMLARRFVNVRNVFIDERLSISLPVQFQKHGGEQSALSSLTLHYANEKSGSEDEMGSYCLSDAGLTALGEGFTKLGSLEKLSLDSEFINNKGILAVALQARSLCAIGEGCKKLKNLALSDCYFLSDKGLEAVAAGCSELTHLEVNGCHNIGTSGLEFVGRSCTYRRLSELTLLYCQKIGNYALSEVGRGCKHLQALQLVDCSSIGDDAICSIASGCRNLKKLHIRRCYEVGNTGIIAVGKNCKFLTDLSIRFCDRVGNEALIAIGQGCPLQHLNVSGCHQMGDKGIIAIARGCPQLTCLDVSVLQNLGDMAMTELGEGCHLLKDIVLSHCRQITDVGLARLVSKCTLLESCHMVYCPGITSAGVATVISSCVGIKKVLVEKWKVSQRTKRRAGSIISYLCVGTVKQDCHMTWVLIYHLSFGGRSVMTSQAA